MKNLVLAFALLMTMACCTTEASREMDAQMITEPSPDHYVIHEIEVGNRLFTHGSDYNLPIFYLLNNEKEKAFSFFKEELKRKEVKAQKEFDDYPFPHLIKDDKSSSTYRILNEYKEFVSKFVERYFS